MSPLSEALRGLRARRRRALLTGVGIALAAAMLSTAAVVGYGLGTGFERSARIADLPDVIARFDPQPPAGIARRVRALPGLAAVSLRREVTNVPIGAGGHSASNGVVEVLGGGRRGYAILSGRDLSSRPGEVLVEHGVARSWGLRVGSLLSVGGLGPQRVVGVSVAPDNVAFPLSAPRIYLSRAGLTARFGARVNPAVNLVAIWVRDRSALEAVLVQARANSYGIRDLRFVTRSGVRVLLDQAAGIVIALLVALSAIALVTAGVMLGASARADIQRRLVSLGIARALGATRARLTLVACLEALLVAAPAAAAGTLVGGLLALGPSRRLLELLNELTGGAGLVAALVACWTAAVAIPVLAVAWPAWRAARRRPIDLLRGPELRPSGRGARSIVRGLAGLGGRLVLARRTRWALTLVVLGVSAGFVLLLLALSSELQTLETDPGALGKRYQISASLPAAQAARVRELPGVQAAAPRYEVQAVDSFALGETIDVIAYPGDHTVFEAPPLATGRRLRASDEAEVGTGLAQVLGLAAGSTLAVQLPSGVEARFRVAGIVSSLDHDGRVAYVPARALLAADPSASEQIAVRLTPGAGARAVTRRLTALGAIAASAPSATARGQTLIGALSAILRAVALVDGLVCLYTLVQALATTARERRTTIAVLRACGAGAGAIRILLAGAAAAVVAPAALIGVILEEAVLGPVMSHLAAGYAALPLSAGPGEVVAVVGGLALLAAGAATWVAGQSARESIVSGLAR